MPLAKAYAMHAFDDRAHPFDGPQFGAKAVLGRASQNGNAHRSQLRWVQLGRAARLGHRPQCIDAALIEQRFPCVHGLSCHSNGQRNLRAALALLQHPPASHPLLCRFAQSLLHHANILQQ